MWRLLSLTLLMRCLGAFIEKQHPWVSTSSVSSAFYFQIPWAENTWCPNVICYSCTAELGIIRTSGPRARTGIFPSLWTNKKEAIWCWAKLSRPRQANCLLFFPLHKFLLWVSRVPTFYNPCVSWAAGDEWSSLLRGPERKEKTTLPTLKT